MQNRIPDPSNNPPSAVATADKPSVTPPGVMPGMGHGGGAPLSLKNLRTFSSFSNPVFRLYYTGMLGQMAAMNMQLIAKSLLVYQLTGSGTILGIMALANSLPMMVFSLFGGVIADRVEKRKVLILGQSASAVVSLLIALSLVFGYMSPEVPGSWIVLVIAALFQGTIQGLMMPSRQAMISDIVSERDLMNAIALNTFGMNILRLAAPALAGFVIAGFGYEAVYYVMTAMYAMAAFFVFLMPKMGVITLKGSGAWASMKDGFVYVRREGTVFLILALTLVMVVLSMPYLTLLPAFTEGILGVGPQGMGIMVSVSGIGAMVGSIVLASLPNRKRGLMMILSGLVLGTALTAFSFSNSWEFSLIAIVFVGLGQTGRMTLSNTLLQYYVHDEYRGRVLSLQSMIMGLQPLGALPLGVVIGIWGAPTGIWRE